MFTLCVAFIVFAGTMFSLQARTLTDNIMVLVGADISIQAPSVSYDLREDEMREFLDKHIASDHNIVEAYTFTAFPMHRLRGLAQTRFGNLPDFPEARTMLVGLEPNYLDVVYSDYFIATETTASDGKEFKLTREGSPDLIEALTSQAGTILLPDEQDGIHAPPSVRSHRTGRSKDADEIRESQLEKNYNVYVDVLMSEGLRDFMSMSVTTPGLLKLRTRTRQGVFLAKARGMVSKVPGFFFSSFALAAPTQPVLISMSQYDRLMKKFLYEDVELLSDFEKQLAKLSQGPMQGETKYEKPPKEKLLIRNTPDATPEQVEDLMNGLRIFYKSDTTISISTKALIADTTSAVDLLHMLFLVVGAISMILCFFILLLSLDRKSVV